MLAEDGMENCREPHRVVDGLKCFNRTKTVLSGFCIVSACLRLESYNLLRLKMQYIRTS